MEEFERHVLGIVKEKDLSAEDVHDPEWDDLQARVEQTMDEDELSLRFPQQSPEEEDLEINALPGKRTRLRMTIKIEMKTRMRSKEMKIMHPKTSMMLPRREKKAKRIEKQRQRQRSLKKTNISFKVKHESKML